MICTLGLAGEALTGELSLPPVFLGDTIGTRWWRGDSMDLSRGAHTVLSPESPLFLAHGPLSHVQREPTAELHAAGAVSHVLPGQNPPEQPSQRLVGSGHSELTWSWPRESRPETQLSTHPAAAAGL